VKRISINESGEDPDGNLYDPRSDGFTTTGELTSHTPLRLINSVTYSDYFITANLNEIVTPASPLSVTLSLEPENAIVAQFIGTVTGFYSIEVAMQYVSGAITYDLDFQAGYALSQ
jgi:hypothetical protein